MDEVKKKMIERLGDILNAIKVETDYIVNGSNTYFEDNEVSETISNLTERLLLILRNLAKTEATIMTHEEFAHICLKIKSGDTSIEIPCCANCKHYIKTLELTGSTYYGCDHPFAGVSLCMKPEDFCSRFEQRKDDICGN